MYITVDKSEHYRQLAARFSREPDTRHRSADTALLHVCTSALLHLCASAVILSLDNCRTECCPIALHDCRPRCCLLSSQLLCRSAGTTDGIWSSTSTLFKVQTLWLLVAAWDLSSVLLHSPHRPQPRPEHCIDIQSWYYYYYYYGGSSPQLSAE